MAIVYRHAPDRVQPSSRLPGGRPGGVLDFFKDEPLTPSMDPFDEAPVATENLTQPSFG